MRIAVDIGGTFTDVVIMTPDRGVEIRKVLTHADKVTGIIDLLAALPEETGVPTEDYRDLVHGTTIVTNAVLERKGAETGLVTTEGLRDVLEIGAMRRPTMYDLRWDKPPALAPRRRRWEVPERLAADGSVVVELDRDALARLVETLNEKTTSVAVCFLHSNMNPAHELLAGETLVEAGYRGSVTLSSSLSRARGEYLRASTAVVNAYVQPIVEGYLERMASGLTEIGWRGSRMVMQSNGSVIPFGAAVDRPIDLLESGPAAGVLAARNLVNELGYGDFLTFDMGGTTAKASVVEDGKLLTTDEYEVAGGLSVASRATKGSGYPVHTAVIEIAEVGAGGGSIVTLDTGGALHVGPESAGSNPGPISYGLGGDEVTVTDANLVAGFLSPSGLLHGRLEVDVAAATDALDRLANERGVSTAEAAFGIHQLANAEMARAMRAVTSERGRDPRRYTIVAFGGAGPVHACYLAEVLDIRRVLVPPAAGVFSAFGLLAADIGMERDRYVQRRVEDGIAGHVAELAREARAEIAEEMSALGYDTSRLQWRNWCELRYVGQTRGLRIEYPGDLGEATPAELIDAFEREHRRAYAHVKPDVPIEMTTMSIAAAIPFSDVAFGGRSSNGDAGSHEPSTRRAYFGPELGWLEAKVFRDRSRIAEAKGPAFLDEYDCTTVIPPGWSVAVESGDVLSLTRGEEG